MGIYAREKNKIIFMEILFFFSFFIFRAAPVAYEGSQAGVKIGTAAAGLHHSHSNARFEPHLHLCHGLLTPWERSGIEPTSSWILIAFLTSWATTGTSGNTYTYISIIPLVIMAPNWKLLPVYVLDKQILVYPYNCIKLINQKILLYV